MSEETSTEVGIREMRANLSDVVYGASIRGQIVYITSRGNRVAAVVPLADAEEIEKRRQGRKSDAPTNAP